MIKNLKEIFTEKNCVALLIETQNGVTVLPTNDMGLYFDIIETEDDFIDNLNVEKIKIGNKFVYLAKEENSCWGVDFATIKEALDSVKGDIEND